MRFSKMLYLKVQSLKSEILRVPTNKVFLKLLFAPSIIRSTPHHTTRDIYNHP